LRRAVTAPSTFGHDRTPLDQFGTNITVVHRHSEPIRRARPGPEIVPGIRVRVRQDERTPVPGTVIEDFAAPRTRRRTSLGRRRCRPLTDNRPIPASGTSRCPVGEGCQNRRTASGRVLNAAEKVTPLEALRAFTVGSAHADRQEHRKGRLSRGMLADFVALSDDLLTVDPEGIREPSVRMTVVGGQVRYAG